MEILIIIISVIVGLIAGFILGRNSTKSNLDDALERIEKTTHEALQREAYNHSEALRRERENHSEAISRLKESNTEALNREQESHIRALDRQKEEFQHTLVRQREEFNTALDRQKAASAEAMESAQKRFDETIVRLQAEIKQTTGEMLRQRQEEFEKTSTSHVGQILQPLEKSLEEMRKSVNENSMRHAEFGGKLTESLGKVLQYTNLARESAERLTSALRGSGKVQGDWGETVLAELLNSQGLTEGVHYETQSVIRAADGSVIRNDEDRSMRPDVILHLDQQRDVIIDAKVSLSAFMDYMEAETEEVREAALQRHIQSVENHVKELAAKNYSAYIREPRISVDYVIMFVPNTTALYAATNARKHLWRKAMENGVYIADEQTLYAALKIIDATWRQISQAENHKRVFQLASQMLDRVQAFMTYYTKIGDQLTTARKAYDDGLKKLQPGGQSIPMTCNKLIKLGAGYSKTAKGVDPELLGLNLDEPES